MSSVSLISESSQEVSQYMNRQVRKEEGCVEGEGEGEGGREREPVAILSLLHRFLQPLLLATVG